MTLFRISGYELSIRVLFAMLGIAGALVATLLAKVSPSLTTRIVWLFVAQMGLICIEVAAGLRALALIHFAGNILLRIYQWLLSPAAASFLIRQPSQQPAPVRKSIENILPRKLRNTIYLLAILKGKLSKRNQKPFNLV